ncbi:MAG TPA: GTP-binding protein [Roseomonas sp.]|nr:GTP-binding protein [Roseomonas sp.]
MSEAPALAPTLAPPGEFVLLAGFLGSGKTSLLMDWLALPEAADTAVIVNEAGEIDIDGAVIATSGQLPMAMLSNGCVCCSLNNDLVETVGALLEARAESGNPPFRRIVLECSGLSMPGPILRTLGALAPLGMRVRVLATCDAGQAAERAKHFEEVAAQLAAAATIVLTRLDLATPEAMAEARALVATVNPFATLVEEPDRARRAALAFTAPLPSGAALTPPGTAAQPHPRIATALARFTEGATLDDKFDFLENLAAFTGDRLLRVKGFLYPEAGGPPLLVQAVGSLFTPPATLPDARGAEEAVVLISRDLPLSELRAAFAGAPVTFSGVQPGRPALRAQAAG